ncbi:MAG: hypothetical protein GX103_10025 [Bacteroidales bacterium]|jgi:hypothetical protein|nr:hypothetical protein [Candidatus Falkowbacteria bacterium]NLO51477.1 hypothetical protein [Bacteroidales bacterium]
MMALVAIVAMPMLQSCKSSKPASKPDGEELITMYCSGPEYFSDSEYFRASNVGESQGQSMAKKKAMSNARLDLAAAIETRVKAVIDNYFSSYTTGDAIQDAERYEGLSREVINQELSGIRTICEQFTKTKDGTYKAYVAIELAGEEILNGMQKRISDDEKLKIDFQYEKFKKEFEKEMDNFKNQ